MCRSDVSPAAAGPLAAVLATIAGVLADREGVDLTEVRIGPVDFGDEEFALGDGSLRLRAGDLPATPP